MSIFGHANDAPMYKPAPWAKPLTHQIDEMKDNWVQSMYDQINTLHLVLFLELGAIALLFIALTAHIYGRI